MSVFYDLASLVLVPSGYKASKVYAQKPLTTDGQLAFSRASTATRVGPNGLIEKVRTNLLLQSNTFSTTWFNNNTTDTGGQSGYDGSSDAWLLSKTGASGSIYQTNSLNGVYTFSVYAKADSNSWIRLTFLAVASAYFDLQNGVVGSQGGIDSSIESIGAGWYRCSFSVNASSGTGVSILPASTDGVISDSSGSIYIQDAQLETGDIATDYIETTTAAVSVGPVANVPRLDYLNSSCPRLLLEPQRTNLITYSEQFDNAAWIKDASTATANFAISPDGYTNADKLFETATTDFHRVYGPTISVTSGTTYTASIFVKAAEVTTFAMELRLTSNVADATFDLVAGTASSGGVIQDYGNGWYRCIVTGTATATGGGRPMFFIKQRSSYAGNTSNGLLIYGAQFEAGAYATSYIPTLGAAVTRGADAASKTGISSLIGQTEGTLYFEGARPEGGNDFSAFSLSDGTTNNEVFFRFTTEDRIEFYYRTGGTQPFAANTTAYNLNQNTKIAFAYKANDVVVYVNGNLISTGSPATTPTGLTQLRFERGNGTIPMIASVSQALLFKTRLTNAQLAELTTL